jgi:hypothetical protein
MAGTRRRFFRPGHAGFQTRDATFKLVFVVVENPGGRRLHAFATIARLGVHRRTHGVANVVVQLRQPVAKRQSSSIRASRYRNWRCDDAVLRN